MLRVHRSACAIRSRRGVALWGRWWPARACTRPRRRSARAVRPAIAGGGASATAAGSASRSAGRFHDGSLGDCRAAAEAEIVAARERSGAGPLTIGALLDRPASTVGKVLRRLGRSRLPREPRPPVVRYERERPGELLHIDTKKLGRFWHVGKRILRDGVQRSPRAGWQHVHVAVDDHSRLAYVEVLPSDRQGNAIAFLERALGWYAAQGITVEEVMTDNGPAYRSHAWRARCAMLGTAAPAHSSLHAAHEREGRALHPDAAAQLGLRLRLPVECAPCPSPLRLAAVVQQTKTPRLPRWPSTGQPCLTSLWSL